MDADLGKMKKEELKQEILKLRSAIRKHRNEKGHDRCWLDDNELYMVLPEKESADTKLPTWQEFSAECKKFYETRQKEL